MDAMEKFEREIAPFTWCGYEKTASVCLDAGRPFLQEIFAEQGWEGSGYDWESLARVFLEERCPDLIEKVHFDPEADMFCAYSDDMEAMRFFIRSFRQICEDRVCAADLLSRAVPD